MDIEFAAGDAILRGSLALPGAPDADRPTHALVLCHGFPSEPLGLTNPGQTYGELAARVAHQTGWTVLAFNFRGTGSSAGDFSLGGWLADLHAAIDFVAARPGVDGVWLAGFSVGGSLAICAAGEDPRVRGVACFAAVADFDDWAAQPEALLRQARQIGVVSSKSFPPDFEAWARELSEIRPLALIGKIPPRPVLLVHGTDDDTVDLVEARALADAADGEVELRTISGAGHRLRHDPRAIAVLLGWLERQDA